MKIIYFFPEYDSPMFFWQRINFIDELSRNGIIFNTFNPLLYKNPTAANEALCKLVRNDNCDVFLTDVCNPQLLFKESLSYIKKTGIPTICFRPDNLVVPYHDKAMAKDFDLVWLTSIETKHLYEDWGCHTIFATYAANPYLYKYEPTNLIRKVCFIGTPSGSRSKMINTIAQAGVDIDVFCKKTGEEVVKKNQVMYDIPSQGALFTILSRMRFKEGRKLNWGTVVHKFRKFEETKENVHLQLLNRVTFEELTLNYSNYSLALASTSKGHTDILKEPLNVINLRQFEIPMSGGIELCKYSEEMSSYYEDKKEILFYRDDDELKDLALYYVNKAPDSEIKRIKEDARKRSVAEHTWMNRFSILFKELNLKI